MSSLLLNRGLALHPFVDGNDVGKMLGSKYPHCKCCPYGFHIDLDFVRFCEELRHRNKFPSIKQRRERQKRKSMEVLMGITSPSMWNVVEQLPVIPQDIVPNKRLSETLEANDIVNDALHDVVQDFELTLKRTGRTKVSSAAKNIEDDSDKLILNSTFEHDRFMNSEYNSNILPGSEIPASQYIVQNNYIEGTSMDFDTSSIGSGASGLSTYTLQNIRQQMVLCLERIRELEDQVKTIPSLQVQLSMLKDDKRKLLKQLQSTKKLDSDADNLNGIQLKHKFIGANNLKDISNNSSFQNSHTSYSLSENSPKPSVRDASTLASVITREVGISSTAPKMRDSATSVNNTPNKLCVHKTGILDIPPDYTSSSNYLSSSGTFLIDDSRGNVLGSVRNGKTEVCDKNTLADLDDVRQKLKIVEYHDCSIQVNEHFWKKDFYCQTYKKRFGHDAVTQVQFSNWQRDSSVQTDFSVRRNNKSVQHDRVISKNSATQCECLSCSKINDKLLKSRYVNASVGTDVTRNDVGCSEDTLNDSFCNKCSVSKQNVSISCDILPHKLSFSASSISLHSLNTIQNNKNNWSQTFTNTSSKTTDTFDIYKYRVCDVGVNTQKKKLVDTSCGTDEIFTPKELCSSCRCPLQSVESKEKQKVLEPAQKSQTFGSRIPLRVTYTPFSRMSHGSKLSSEEVLDSETTSRHLFSMSKSKEDVKTGNDSKYSFVEERGNDSKYSFVEEKSSNIDESSVSHMESSISLSSLNKTLNRNEPSKEMKAAMKVLNDSLKKSQTKNMTHNIKNAINIIQQEWFKISSTSTANPLDVEAYLDSFEAVSPTLLKYIVNMSNGSGNTAMHYAVSHGNFDVVSILLDSKVCNINQPNAAGYTCVMLLSLAEISSETHRQVVRRLFQFADVNVRAKQHGQTALMLAVSHGRLDTVKLLIEAGADINIQDEDGSTALMCAAEHGHEEIVKQLLSCSECDVTIRDCDGTTALDIAMDAGNRDIGVLIYAHEMFTRGRSPYNSLRHRRSKSATPTMRSQTAAAAFQNSPSPNLNT